MAKVQQQQQQQQSRGKVDLTKQKCITPRGRLSFPALFEPKAFGSADPKYSCILLVDKDLDLSTPVQGTTTSVKGILHTAAVRMWGKDKTKWPKFKHGSPIKDGDEKKDVTGYEGCWYFSASCKPENPPGIVDRKGQPILNASDLYAGCYVRLQLMAYAYDNKYGAGLGLSLQNVQKLEDGESFTGKESAASAFGGVATGVDDDDEEDEGDDGDDDDGDSAGF